MKNRAKCKKCLSTIESFHEYDHVTCKCGEISVTGGDRMECAALDWKNFLRVDDCGNEIVVKVQNVKPLYNEDSVGDLKIVPTPKEDLIKMLDEMIYSYERLPIHAMSAPVTNADLCSALMLICGIIKKL